MDIRVSESTFAQVSRETVNENSAAFGLRWLGQAGFEVFTAKLHLLIDPYLSDHLAKKYAGKEFAHQRMMESPLSAVDVRELDYLLCTHRHSDHIDPETVPVLLENNSQAKMIAPRAERDHVVETMGIAEDRVIFVNAGDTVELDEKTIVRVIPSSHEELKTDSAGNHHFLGYIITSAGRTIYHSGDCVPFAGQKELLIENNVELALLPINGRDEYRASRGVPGNMKFNEALQLCQDAGIRKLICHHFGMFSFNTADLTVVEQYMAKLDPQSGLSVIIPKSSLGYQIK